MKVVCTIKGSYTDSFGCPVSYEYRVFDTDTMAEFVRLKTCELKAHPNAKQIIVWED